MANVNAEIHSSNVDRAQTREPEKEIAHRNEVLSSELLMSQANSQHREAKISL